MTRSHYAATDSARRLLVVRGDLRSRTGIAYDVRAKMRLLGSDLDIVGVDVHPDPNDREGPFLYPIISDDEVPRRIAASLHRPIILHHTPPDDFRGFPGAWNIGSFFWETDVAPRLRQWAVKIALMDAMWAPCSMIANLIRSMGYTGPIHDITWPFDFAQSRRSDPKLRQSIDVRLFGSLGTQGFETRGVSLAELRVAARNLFVTVQSMSSRKGLPILLREWQAHQSEAGNSNDLLVLRLAFRHASNLSDLPEDHVASMLQDAGFRFGQKSRIAIITGTLSDAELTELFQASDAYVSATLGEGFGGPIMEAIVNDRPVIVPRHTAMCDYIAPDYPLTVRSERRLVGLRGGLSVYPPASSWHVPAPGSVAAHLAAFVRMTAAERAKLALGLRGYAAQFCSVPVVRHALQAFFRGLLAEPLARVSPT
jgi:hypothetical protein